jgi:uncharacterized protein YfaS (alpha-2-macroglobulin family)
MLNKIFGHFSWNSPQWIKQLQHKAKENPKQFISRAFFSLVFLIAAIGIYQWYQSLPKPERIIAKITLPKLTPPEATLIPDVLTIDFGISYNGAFNSRSVAPLNLVGKEISKDIAINPPIPGQWRWDSDSRLVFTPESDWPAEQTYQIKFNKHFFTDGTKMAAWQYAFTTLPFSAAISEFKFYQDPQNPHIRKAVATVNFSFPVEAGSLTNKIRLTWQALKNGKYAGSHEEVKFTVSYDKNKRVAYIHSESLTLPSSERFLQLTLEKGIKSLIGPAKTSEEYSKTVLVPDASSYFKIADLTTAIVRNLKDQPEQVLTVATTIGVTEAELTKSIHAYYLPQDYPANAVEVAKKNYQWQDPGEVTPAILALAKPIVLAAIPAEQDYASLHSYRYQAPAAGFMYVTIDKGIKGFGDFMLANSYSAVFKIPAYPQEISFLHKGSLLALGSEEKLSVLVRGLSAVKFNIARVLPTDVNHLITQTSGDFSNPSFYNMSFNQYDISQIFSQIQAFDASDAAKAQYTALDFSKFLAANTNGGPRGLFLLQAQGYDPEKKTTLDAVANRLILITDLGLIVKDNADGSHDMFVQSIRLGTPVNQASVSLLGRNGLSVINKVTDANGHANFPSLNDIIYEREPTVYLVQSGNDVSFIPYSHYDRRLNYSRFDVGGVTTNTDNQAALTAYIFTDRGIYRPGDTAHVAMVVKQPFVLAQPAGLPLEATVIDPRGVTIKDEKITLNDTGYFTFDFQTTDTSPTGQYIINLYIVKDNHASNLIGSSNIEVGEFLPDRMRISAHLSQATQLGWVSPSALTAKVGLWNLYGAAAVNHRVSGKVLLTPQTIKFKNFPDYIFFDPLLNPKTPPKVFSDTLKDTQTDSQGQAELDLKLERFEKATYQLTVFAEGFEAEGGRSVTTQVNALVSPLNYLIAYKTDGDLNYIKQNAARTIHLIAVDPQLKQISLDNLTIQLLKLQPVSTLVKKDDGTFQYQSIIQSKQISTTPYSIHAEGDDYQLPANEFGDYLLIIADQNGLELSKLKFSIVGDSKQPLPKDAELSVKLNKTEFNVGDEIEMQVTAPFTGAGLITIERDKTYASQWFKTDNTSSLQKIKIPADFQGDGYINIAFVRDFNSPDIFMNPLSYSVVPFTVTHKNRTIQVDLSVAERVLPGTPLLINYKTDKPSKIIVFAVDEGVLQVTQYKTPDPLQFFFQKHALEVTTQQIVDQILPKFVGERELSAVGGDNVAAVVSKTLNPFKRKTELPVVFWSNVLDSDTSMKQLTYPIPDYFNGSLRIMAVAVAAEAVGSAAKTTEVRGHFVINSNVPTFVAPGDTFEVAATVANNVEGSGENAKVKITLTSSAQIKINEDANQTITIPEGQERSVHYKVKASALLGSAELTFSASNGNKSSKMSSTLSVRPPVAYMTDVSSGYTEDAKKVLPISQTLYPEFRKVVMAVSRSPLILATGLNAYLSDYPYGCVEQLVSKAFMWLSMANQPWFATDSVNLHKNIQQTIDMLTQRQMSSGAFNYWPEVGTTQSNDFASVYAMHFLTEAKTQTYSVPADVFSAGIGFLKDLATREVSNLADARLHAYAIYVLTRNEIVTTNYLTNLLLYFEQHKEVKWQQDITSAYIASIYQLLKNSPEADKIIAYYQPQHELKDIEGADFYNINIANAQYIYLLSKHFPQRLANADMKLILPLVAALNNETMSTLLAGYASLALSQYDAYYTLASAAPAPISINDMSATNDKYQQANISPGIKNVDIKNSDKKGYFYQLTQAGFNKTLPTKMLNQGIEVYREFKTLDNAELSNVTLGDEIIVHIRARSLDNQYHANIAIVDLLPGGFEVVRGSITVNNMDYTDVREDRVIFFAGLQAEANDIVYRIKPTSLGTFTVPPIFAMAMYNPMLKSLGTASNLTVKEK